MVDHPAMPAPGARSRGRTAPGRLAVLDRYIAEREPGLLSLAEAPFDAAAFVDVGIGDNAATTLETAAHLQSVAPHVPCVGVDHDLRRVEAAREAHPQMRWLHVDVLRAPDHVPPARMIRVVNVLRGYGPKAAADAIDALCERLLPGGLLLEGTTDRGGSVLCVQLRRRRRHGAYREALLFATDFSSGFGPWMFRDHLPRSLAREVGPDAVVGRFFRDWAAEFERQRSARPHADNRARFEATAHGLSRRRPDVPRDEAMFERGQLELTFAD